MLEEVIALGDRALVFTQYAEMGTLLRDYLETTFGREVLFLHGGTPTARARPHGRPLPDRRDGRPVFILSLKAGGTGLNLTRANHVFHFDRWWNPAVENQATDRAFRIGQRRNVQVHKYVCAGTFEETLDDLIERKLALSESIVGTGEAWITEMSTERCAICSPCATTRWRRTRVSRYDDDDGDWGGYRGYGYSEPRRPIRPGQWDQGPDAARRVRQDLVGQPLDRRPGAAGRTRAACTRGRSYARSGQVVSSTSTAQAGRRQGPGQQAQPYKVRSASSGFDDAGLGAGHRARWPRRRCTPRELLSGEMPERDRGGICRRRASACSPPRRAT